MEEKVQMVPLAALEAAEARHHAVLKWLVIGWAASIIFVSSVLYSFAFSEYETTTETTTTETTISQDSGDSGSNTYVGGDMVG